MKIPGVEKTDWIENASLSLSRYVPQITFCSTEVSEKLAELLLRRLPAQIGDQLLALLVDVPNDLRSCLTPNGDPSIGYPDFLERSYETLAIRPEASVMQDHKGEELSRKVTDIILRSFMEVLPEQLKIQLVETLPSELHHKMTQKKTEQQHAA